MRSSSNIRLVHKQVAAALLFAVALVALWALPSCSRKPTLPQLSSADSMMIVQDNMAHRTEVDSVFRYDENSPFGRDTTIEFHGIKWFPIDPRFRGSSQLYRYENPETVIVLGTKGEERKQLRYGYFSITVPGENDQPVTLKMNVYKFTPYDKKRYALYKDALSVWFTDKTTGIETYSVGRYVEVGNEDPRPDHAYIIDFNKAYNPYCAYSKLFSCAVPRKEDHLDIALRVGEMKYHE
jgi:uncharacterized protein (DUF1684 family)